MISLKFLTMNGIYTFSFLVTLPLVYFTGDMALFRFAAYYSIVALFTLVTLAIGKTLCEPLHAFHVQ